MPGLGEANIERRVFDAECLHGRSPRRGILKWQKEDGLGYDDFIIVPDEAQDKDSSR